MSKLKKVLLMCTAYVLVAALAIGGTLAYLTSSDEDINVMTMGNVKIEQIEQQYDENGNLVDFVQDKPLYPYVGELGWKNTDTNNGAYRQFTMNNVVDKYVSVKNIGKSDAYVRTFIALEMGSFTYDEFTKIGISINSENGSEFKFPGAWNTVNDFVEVIDGHTYNVMEFVHSAPLKPGETTIPSLLQVYLSKDATNEDVKKLDGNGNGKYDIIVISQAVQAAGFADAKTALDTAFGAPKDINAETGVALCAEWLGNALIPKVDTWDGTADTSWYDPANPQSAYAISTAEQLAAFADLVDAGNTFEGKTVFLDTNIDLADKLFDPIGSYRYEKSFKGTFDGQGHTISNLSQNTWELDNGYAYSDCGLGLFGAVENGIVKNLIIDGADISGESGLCGTVAAVAENAVFENITVKNANVADYQYYAGGIVGWASGEITVNGCNLDASTTIAAQWGEFNNANGGVIGGVSTSADILIKDCTVACRIDAYNDVTSAYEWYSYRRSGMLIGDSGQMDDPDGDNVGNAIAPNLTCENVTVIYGDWANYHYCEFNAERYPWVRVEAGISNSAYSNVRYGHPTDANGNEVVDDNHVHNDGEKHNELIVFDQLYGGKTGDRYCTYGTATHDGVTVIYNNK